MRRVSISVIALAFSAIPLHGDDALPPGLIGVGIDQKLDGQVPLDLAFRDEHDQRLTLAECLHGKPAILILAYYRCPMLCNQVLNGVLEALSPQTLSIGKEFNVVTVSFDAREKPPLAGAKKANYVWQYGRPGAEGGWHFLTGDQPAIDRLTGAVGFHYRYDAATEQFAHASGIMVLTPDGRLSRYFYGIHYSPRDVRLGLVEASAGRIGSPVDRILLFCYHYDAATGKYAATVMNLVRAGGVLTLIVLGGFLVFNWRRDWRASRKQAGALSLGDTGNVSGAFSPGHTSTDVGN
jgi:protein SCO1/2